jgi:branched-chain amino acid transport system permease protein
MQPCGTYNPNYEVDMAIVRTRLQWGLFITLLVFLMVIPLFANPYVLNLIILISIAIIVVHGLNILVGYAGQISLGQAAFMAVGAYTSAILTARLGWSFWAALPCAGLSAGVIGLIFGLPSLRVKGFYLALATLAAQFIILYVIQHLTITGGTSGIRCPPASIGGFAFDTRQSYYYIAMGLTVLMTFFAKNLTRTRVGRAFIAVRDNDLAAEVLGVHVFYYKLLAFFIGCFYAGIAGSLWAHYLTSVHPEQFPLINSIWYLGMVVVGGMGSILGAIIGTIFIKLLDELMMVGAPMIAASFPAIGENIFAAIGSIAFGLVIILFLIYEPRGLAHRWEVFKASYRLWPFSY